MPVGRSSLALFSIALLVAINGCGADSEPAEEAAEATEAPEPEGGGFQLGSAADLVVVSEDVGDQLSMLSLGDPSAAEPTPAPVEPATPKPRRTDPGLGVAGGKTVSATQIKATIRQNSPQVRACYERQLKSTPSLRGKVVVAWTVGADGKVRSPRAVSNTTGNRDMLPCIRRAVKSWQFARAESPQDIEYPFVFKPREF